MDELISKKFDNEKIFSIYELYSYCNQCKTVENRILCSRQPRAHNFQNSTLESINNELKIPDTFAK